MALIADLCPNCRRVTRCNVVERSSIAGGILMGVPLVLPLSSVSCTCGECGCEFCSEFWNHGRAASPVEAMSLHLEALLTYTNPVLKEKLTLTQLKANPQLSGTFDLLERLAHGSLRTALKDALQRWLSLDEARQIRFLANVDDCSKALAFARSMAGRYRLGAAGCLAGILGSVGAWSGCILVFGLNLTIGLWVAVFTGGVVAGGLLSALFWSNRDRRWVKGALLPEARDSGIRPEALLAVLEGGGSAHQVDELNHLRQLAPAVRAELAAAGESGGEFCFDFAGSHGLYTTRPGYTGT